MFDYSRGQSLVSCESVERIVRFNMALRKLSTGISRIVQVLTNNYCKYLAYRIHKHISRISQRETVR